MTLADAIDALYERFGCYVHSQQSLAFSGRRRNDADGICHAAPAQQSAVQHRRFPCRRTHRLPDETRPVFRVRMCLPFRSPAAPLSSSAPPAPSPKLKPLPQRKGFPPGLDADAQLYALEDACRTLLQF